MSAGRLTRACTVADFKSYTESLRNPGFVWSDESLDEFLHDSGKLVPGTGMAAIGRIVSAQDRRNIMKHLLGTTAILEFVTGLVLVADPSVLSTLLFGAQLDNPIGLTVARVGGVALLAIGTACWLARVDGHSRAARGLAGAMVIYNAGTVAIFVFAGLALRLSGIGLWPVVLVHAAMAIWCVTSLVRRRL